jgi:hypothetical protein
MPDAVVQGGRLTLTPKAGWRWSGWNGRLDIRVQSHDIGGAEGNAFALFDDIKETVERGVKGKSYTASGYDQPGSVMAVQVTVDAATLSEVLTVDGKPCVTAKTEGKFRIVVSPARSNSSPPTPDPVAQKSGNWTVDAVGQSACLCD